MKIVGILGSPRKKSNSSELANRVLDAAREKGAETEAFVLNDLDYKGCQACMGCKGKKDYCIIKDDLTPVLEAMREADAVVLASPVYYGDVSGQFRLWAALVTTEPIPRAT